MGVSIYYQFQSDKELHSSGYLVEIEGLWRDMFEGHPYETWSWYEPKVTEESPGNLRYTYEGATGLAMDDEEGPISLLKALEVLTKIRNEVGGSIWSVNLDDLEIPWDEASSSYCVEM